MNKLTVATSLILLLGGNIDANAQNVAKSGIYTLRATVLSASSAVGCPFGVGQNTTDMDGYSAFAGFQVSGSTVSMSQDWVIAISPATAEEKYGYDLVKPNGVLGDSVKFSGTARYGGANSEFSGRNGSYVMHLNPATLASTLTVSDAKCIITYSLTFKRGIPTKFLNLL